MEAPVGQSRRKKLLWANMEDDDEGEAVIIILENNIKISMYAEDGEKSKEQHNWPQATN